MSARTLVRGPIGRLAAVSLGSNIVDGIRVAAFTVLTTAYADSALEVALVATVATLPKAFLSIPIGVMLDRWSKLRTLYLVNLARARALPWRRVDPTTLCVRLFLRYIRRIL